MFNSSNVASGATASFDAVAPSGHVEIPARVDMGSSLLPRPTLPPSTYYVPTPFSGRPKALPAERCRGRFSKRRKDLIGYKCTRVVASCAHCPELRAVSRLALVALRRLKPPLWPHPHGWTPPKKATTDPLIFELTDGRTHLCPLLRQSYQVNLVVADSRFRSHSCWYQCVSHGIVLGTAAPHQGGRSVNGIPIVAFQSSCKPTLRPESPRQAY